MKRQREFEKQPDLLGRLNGVWEHENSLWTLRCRESLVETLKTLYWRLSISVVLKERNSASLGGLKSQIRELVKVEIACQLAAY